MEYFETRDNVCDYQRTSSPNKTTSEIQEFMRGKSILITGSTGLLGSLLLENILRNTPDVSKIYLLLRSKKGVSMDERLNSLFASEMFCKVRQLHRKLDEKVAIISGDIALPWCGMSPEDRALLVENVDVVYHAAAALRMDEKLGNSYYMNVRATQQLLEIGTQMKKLKAFVYVSTAYSNSFLPDISEKFFDTNYSADDIKYLVEQLGEEELARLTPKLIGQWGNTYAFTKAMAEKVAEHYAAVLPVAVARPSIVIGCDKDPLVGWINNVYGATGVALAASIGIMRVWYGGKDVVADIIPADKVVTAMVAISWQMAKYHAKGKRLETPVFNIVSSAKSPQTWTDYMTYTEYFAKFQMNIPKKFVRLYNFHLEDRYWMYKIKLIMSHVVFGVIVDLIMKLKGKQPMLIKGFIKINNFNMQLARYCSRDWVCYQENMDRLWSEMTEKDKELYNFDMTNFNWMGYHANTIRGITVYLLKDDYSQAEQTKKRYARMEKISCLVTCGCYGVVLFFLRHYLINTYHFLSDLLN